MFGKHAAVLLVGLLVAGLLVAVWLRSDHDSGVPSGLSPAPAQGEPTAAARSDAHAGPVGTRVALDGEADPDFELVDEPAAADRSWRVRVVTDRGEPVPGVTIWVGDNSLGYQSDPAAFEREGEGFVADDEAVAEIPMRPYAVLAARAGGRLGLLYLTHRAPAKNFTETLVLYPAHALHVRTVSADGTPRPGFRISIRFVGPDHDAGESFGGGLSGLTEGPDARCTWPFFGTVIANRLRGDERIASTRIHATIPTGGFPVVEVANVPPPGAVIDVVVPDTGALIVDVLDPSGRPLPDGWIVTLWPAEAVERRRANVLVQATADGMVRFAPLPLGQVISLTFNKLALGDFLGPTRAVPERRVEARLPASSVVVRGVAVDAKGKRLADRRMSAHAVVDGVNVRSGATLDPEGRFTMLWDERLADRSGLRAYLVLHAQDGGREESVVDISSRLPLRAGVNDLGEVEFLPEEVMVAGRVVPAADAPCRDYSAWIEVSSGGAWARLTGRVHIDGESFRVPAPDPGLPLRLVVVPAARCHVPPPPVEFEYGATDLRVDLDRGHTVAVHVILPDGLERWPTAPYYLVMRPVAGDAMFRVPADVEDGVRSSGRGGPKDLYWNGLVPGAYRLELRIHGIEEVLHAVEGIVVPAPDGELVRVEIDVSRVIETGFLRLIDSDGNHARRWLLGMWFGEALLAVPTVGHPVDGGLRVHVVPGRTDLLAMIPAHAPVWLRGFSGRREVRFERCAFDLSVAVHPPPALPAGVGLRVRVELGETYPGDWRFDDLGVADPWPKSSAFSFPKRVLALWPTTSTAYLDGQGEATLEVSRPGEATISVEVVALPDPTRLALERAVAPVPGAGVRIALPGVGGAPIQIEVPPAALAAAVRELGVR